MWTQNTYQMSPLYINSLQLLFRLLPLGNILCADDWQRSSLGALLKPVTPPFSSLVPIKFWLTTLLCADNADHPPDALHEAFNWRRSIADAEEAWLCSMASLACAYWRILRNAC